MSLLDRFRYRKHTPSPRLVGYVILPSNEIHNYMRRLQVADIGPYDRDLCLAEAPHITIKQGFQIDALEPFEAYFDQLASEIEPFEIAVTGIGFFDPGIVFLDIEQDVRLQRLRMRVLDDLSTRFDVVPSAFEDDRYYFHATLAHGLDQATVDQLREALKDRKVDFRFVFDTLGMFYYTGQEWIVYKRLEVPRRAA